MERKQYSIVVFLSAVGLSHGTQRVSKSEAIEEEQAILSLIVSAYKKPGTKASFARYDEARCRLIGAVDVLGGRQLRSLQKELVDAYEVLLEKSPALKE